MRKFSVNIHAIAYTEPVMTKPDNSTAAWISLFRAQKRAMESAEQAMKRAGLPPLAWYDVLLELEKAGPAGLRPYELERQLLLPQYGLSRLTDRLVKAGLLEKIPCPEDGRGHILAVTADGLEMRQRMWAVYAPVIDACISGRLKKKEMKALATYLDKIGND